VRQRLPALQAPPADLAVKRLVGSGQLLGVPTSSPERSPHRVDAAAGHLVPEEALKRLFAACAGNTFEARRDTALLMLLLGTGARWAEMAGIKLADVDLELDVLLVLGKGRRERTLPFGRRAGRPWIATYGLAAATSTLTCRGFGWARTAG
jgi:site-specific recombinase XerD